MRVAVIGAGPVGLQTLYSLLNRNIPDLELICYDNADQPGGDWLFTEEVGTDEFGIPVHGSMYKGMRTNLPLPLMQIHPSFPWPDDVIDFPYRETVLDYICSFAKKHSLYDYIKFRHYVREVSRHGDGDKPQLMVRVENLLNRQVKTEIFDYVVFCVGKHGKPYIPHDTSEFTGQVFHYHDIKDPKRLANKQVLIVGAGFGALDMVIHLKRVAKSLVQSYHTKMPFYKDNSGIDLKPEITKFAGNTVTFVDGSSADFDAIVYATGFIQTHPLAPELELDWRSGKAVLYPLYKHVVHPKCPTILFCGKAAAATIQSGRVQAEFASSIITGDFVLPNEEEMLQAIKDLCETWVPILKDRSKTYRERMPKVDIEFEIAAELAELCHCSPIPLYLRKLYYSLVTQIADDLFNYQNYHLVLTKPESSDVSVEYYISWAKP